jgi:hypothetical protein
MFCQKNKWGSILALRINTKALTTEKNSEILGFGSLLKGI